jgi:hypothetical protein
MSGDDGNSEPQLGLGEIVTIEGRVKAHTKFDDGQITYLIEYERKGRTVSDWFNRGDLITETEEDGGGI